MTNLHGLLTSDTPGRTDRLPIAVAPNSYIVPADVVSGYGQGNTQAGASIMNQIFAQHIGLARKKAGGAVLPSGLVPIIAAGGEYVIHPKVVEAIGGGDADKGHKILDKMVRERRKSVAKHLMSLPGPKRD